jgi:anaerobic dimethyl sulfoxide reductase subunit B (iron-sulfur subunit)
MSKKAIYFDMDRCVGCYTCQIACKQENDLQPHNVEDALKQTAPVWRTVIEVEKGEYHFESINYISLSCMHCADAPCVIACPKGALSINKEDGRVLVEKSKCIGCRMCLQVCPFGIPQYGEDGLMEKCNLCLARLKEKGKEPACVAACPAKALRYGKATELSRIKQQKAAAKLVLETGNLFSDHIGF